MRRGGAIPVTNPRRPATDGGPIFIVGCQGAGIALVGCLLDAHERIAIPRETGFMRAARAQRFIPFWAFGGSWYKRLGWTESEFDAVLRDFYGALFHRHAERQGKERWGDRTPWHVWHIDEIARLFADAVFIGVVRHPAGNAASNMTRFGHSPKRAAAHYARTNRELVRQAARLGERFVLLRYEDLALEPEPVLRELLDWLGEPWSDRPLLDLHVDASPVSKWSRTVDETAGAELRTRTRTLATFFGYGLEDAGRPAPFEPGGDVRRRLLGGADVEHRMAALPGIDLGTPGSVPLIERPFDPRELAVYTVEARDTPSALARASPAAPRGNGARHAVVPTLRRIRRLVAVRARTALRQTHIRRAR
ncbi:MAG TPA: sulfotransferase [Solirubrobacteraceae bacterium]|nr:sulfotransferase [Solirubrobacteraceae bacterium]